MNVAIREKQNKLLSLVVKFNDACTKLGINYSLACGTLLGAVREHGFIKWDDDLDIMMRLSDYNIMDKNYQSFRQDFAWVCSKSEKHSPVVLARIYPADVDFDNLENYPYIDIHVFVGCSDDDKETKKCIDVSDFATKIYWIKKRRYHNIFRRKKSLIGTICKIPLVIVPSKLCEKIIYAATTRWNYDGSEKIMPVQGYYKMKEVLGKEVLEDYILLDFEEYKLPVIKEYDLYLTQLYGDYMTPVKFN